MKEEFKLSFCFPYPVAHNMGRQKPRKEVDFSLLFPFCTKSASQKRMLRVLFLVVLVVVTTKATSDKVRVDLFVMALCPGFPK